jgi:hypothetical protein
MKQMRRTVGAMALAVTTLLPLQHALAQACSEQYGADVRECYTRYGDGLLEAQLRCLQQAQKRNADCIQASSAASQNRPPVKRFGTRQ